MNRWRERQQEGGDGGGGGLVALPITSAPPSLIGLGFVGGELAAAVNLVK